MNTIITIGREFGSAGHEIGEKLAKTLQIPFYDKELLSRAAKESGFCEEMIISHDEKPTNSFLYNLVMDTYSMRLPAQGMVDMPLNQKVFLAQFDTIKKIAEEGACVIVGRCADYALEDNPNHVSIFIEADMDAKIRRIMEKYRLNEGKAREMIIKKDKERRSYYNFYASKKWGRSDTYDLCIRSNLLGIDGTVKLLTQFVNDFEEARQ